MPVEGFETITVPTDLYNRLRTLADKTQRSIPKTVEFLLENCKEA